jgi:hypothetical protein
LPRGKVCKISNIRVGDRLEHLSHRGVIAWARVVFIPSQGLQKIILSLPGDGRNVRLPREIGTVADSATMLAGEDWTVPCGNSAITPASSLGMAQDPVVGKRDTGEGTEVHQ